MGGFLSWKLDIIFGNLCSVNFTYKMIYILDKMKFRAQMVIYIVQTSTSFLPQVYGHFLFYLNCQHNSSIFPLIFHVEIRSSIIIIWGFSQRQYSPNFEVSFHQEHVLAVLALPKVEFITE